MQDALTNSVRQFEQEAERALLFLLALMRPEGRGGQQLDWSRCAEAYALWAETSAHAGLLSRILVYQAGPDGDAKLQELPLGEAEPVAVDWGPQLKSVERGLAQASARLGRGRGPLTWTLFPEASAVVRPIVTPDRLRRGAPRGPRSGGSAFIIVVLDRNYVAQEMLPGLVERLFSGADGERLYEVAIAVRDGESFLYRSDPSLDSAWLAGADVRRRLRLFRPPPERPGPPLAPACRRAGRRRPAGRLASAAGGAGPHRDRWCRCRDGCGACGRSRFRDRSQERLRDSGRATWARVWECCYCWPAPWHWWWSPSVGPPSWPRCRWSSSLVSPTSCARRCR